ncbi:polysaccharide biosynthesis protein [Oceaniradius stylonematis]|uniref:polysaccharide biosynthesis protein n=1 Tax=Oceaniradius stylonematis TaxID=2184161 RepID=UPI00273E90B2|nr:nucleoside-diphosphate sugar epimerase/dehydratase [Oceaniradius stylonematis]
MKWADPAAWPRWLKKSMVIAADGALIPISLYTAFALRIGTIAPHQYAQVSPLYFLITLAGGVVVLWALRIHRMKLHAFDMHAVARIGAFAAALTFLAIAVSYLFGLWAPRSVPLIFGAVFFLNAVALRMIVLGVLGYVKRVAGSHVPVAIYGAGAAGTQLANALRQSRELRPVIFVDDNSALHGIIIGGARVCHPSVLEPMARSGQIERVLIAIPSMTMGQRERLTKTLEALPCEVQAIPSYVDLVSGKSWVDDLRPVSPDELLEREKVDLDIPEVAKAYAGRSVMVTGAGGSIGSELCRQLIDCRPSRIVLFERSEFALYEIERTLRTAAEQAGIALVARLGSVIDRPSLDAVIADETVDIILHAAAYKHVPLVEDNELEGIRNNVVGTRIVAAAAQEAGIERFILVSTDKAVRPTNIMGASKRMAELVVQDTQKRAGSTLFSMVRFGNVLGSSGSVVPLFQQQIRRGGPVTVTHAEVTRYFMTIPEAARLVLLAGAYSEGGDLFVLDMGSPVRIIDLAKRMIGLANRTVRDDANPDGDIEIVFTGLRPGEKLFEELLIDDDSLVTTPHEKILRAHEAGLSEIEVARMTRQIDAALASRDRDSVRQIVCRFVDGYSVADDAETVDSIA